MYNVSLITMFQFLPNLKYNCNIIGLNNMTHDTAIHKIYMCVQSRLVSAIIVIKIIFR